MDRSPGSDDMIAAREEERRDAALDVWHATHEDPHDWPDCWDCENEIDSYPTPGDPTGVGVTVTEHEGTK